MNENGELWRGEGGQPKVNAIITFADDATNGMVESPASSCWESLCTAL